MEIVRLVPERIEGRFSGARPGVHHVAWAVPPASVENLRSELEDRGLPEYLSAQLGELDITFHDASASLGHDIEIHVDSQGLRDFFQMVREAPRVGTGRNRFVAPPPDSEIELADRQLVAIGGNGFGLVCAVLGSERLPPVATGCDRWAPLMLHRELARKLVAAA
jgi:hypothetical protein